MPYDNYPRPKDDTGLGIHGGSNSFYPLGETDESIAFAIKHANEMAFKWFKLLNSGDGSALKSIQAARASGMETIVRCYRPHPHVSTLDADPKQKAGLPLLVAAGNKYFEVQNEPNVKWEWPNDYIPPDAHEIVALNFSIDADYILSIGGIPLITAMSPGGEPGWDDIEFLQHMLWWLKDNWGIGKLARCALAVHNACFNHPLDYPFDSVNQKGTPVTPEEYAKHQWSGTIEQVNAWRLSGMHKDQELLDPGASNGWNKYRAVHELCLRETGLDLPVLSTEGGEWPDESNDNRYWHITKYDVTDVYNRIRRSMRIGEYPEYYFCTGFWLWANAGMGNPNHPDFEKQTWFNANGIWIDSVQAYKDDGIFVRPLIAPPVNDPPPPRPLTDNQVAQYCRNEGFNGTGLQIGIAIVLAECGGAADASAYNDYGNDPAVSVDRGMWEINSYWHPEVSKECAYDPECSTHEAFRISDGGTNWSQWATYTFQTYLYYMDRAAAAIAATGYPDYDTLFNAAWNAKGIRLNKGAKSYTYAMEHGLIGSPESNEYDFTCECGPFVGQDYRNNDGCYFVYWPNGNTDAITHVKVG